MYTHDCAHCAHGVHTHYVEQERQLHRPVDGWLVGGAFRLSQNSAVIIRTFLGFERCYVVNLWSAEASTPVYKIFGTLNMGVYNAVQWRTALQIFAFCLWI